jgi:hypothetical protein
VDPRTRRSRFWINGIIDVICNCGYWNRYKGTISGKYLNKRHNQYCKWGVYECLYRIILLSYYSTNKFNKLKYQSIDSTFVKNLYGAEIYGRDIKYKSKNGIKISVIVDINGVPNSIAIAGANNYDSKIAMEQINNVLIETDTKSVENNNKYKQYIIGDAAYCSTPLCNALIKQGYTPIMDVNKRNTKNRILLRKMNTAKRKYRKIQNKRLVVENFNSWLHKYPKLDRVIEKSTKSFRGLLLLGCSILVNNKLG